MYFENALKSILPITEHTQADTHTYISHVLRNKLQHTNCR